MPNVYACVYRCVADTVADELCTTQWACMQQLSVCQQSTYMCCYTVHASPSFQLGALVEELSADFMQSTCATCKCLPVVAVMKPCKCSQAARHQASLRSSFQGLVDSMVYWWLEPKLPDVVRYVQHDDAWRPGLALYPALGCYICSTLCVILLSGSMSNSCLLLDLDVVGQAHKRVAGVSWLQQ